MKTFFLRDHYVFSTLSQIYLGRSHVCKSLFLAILVRRKKGLRNTDVNEPRSCDNNRSYQIGTNLLDQLLYYISQSTKAVYDFTIQLKKAVVNKLFNL